MDASRFDGLARALAAPRECAATRRGFLAGLGALAAGLLGLRAAEAACPPGQVKGAGGKCLCKTTLKPPVGGVCPCPSGQKQCFPGGPCLPPGACCADADCPAKSPFCVDGDCRKCLSGQVPCTDGSCIAKCGSGGTPTLFNGQCVCHCGVGPCFPGFVCGGPGVCACPAGTDVCVTAVNPPNTHCAAACPGNLFCGNFICIPGSICSGDIHDPASGCLCPPGTVLCIDPQDSSQKSCAATCPGGLTTCNDGATVCGANAICVGTDCTLCPGGEQRCSTDNPANSVCQAACPAGQNLNHSTCACA